MGRRFAATVLSLAAIGALATSAAAQDRLTTPTGDIVITPLAHASVQIVFGTHVIQVDPWSVADLAHARPADLVLVTDADAGAHHLDAAAIAKVRKHDATVVIPASGQARLPDGIVLRNGERRAFGAIDVEAVPAYDLTAGEPFHAKGVANGYVITLGGTRVFVAGVTECVPEIRALRNIAVMFVPMNLPNGRMTAAAAAECVRTVKPAIVYPYHYDQGYIRRRSDGAGVESPPDVLRSLDELARLIQPDGIELRRGAWYPAP
jgi:L-ascorbate metabolism protein UlaG (beta-lactamase superfamily)